MVRLGLSMLDPRGCGFRRRAGGLGGAGEVLWSRVGREFSFAGAFLIFLFSFLMPFPFPFGSFCWGGKGGGEGFNGQTKGIFPPRGCEKKEETAIFLKKTCSLSRPKTRARKWGGKKAQGGNFAGMGPAPGVRGTRVYYGGRGN